MNDGQLRAAHLPHVALKFLGGEGEWRFGICGNNDLRLGPASAGDREAGRQTCPTGAGEDYEADQTKCYEAAVGSWSALWLHDGESGIEVGRLGCFAAIKSSNCLTFTGP